MLVALLVIVGVAVGVALGVYGRWAGWGWGLGWWGKPTPARVLEVTPLTGALMNSSTFRLPTPNTGSPSRKVLTVGVHSRKVAGWRAPDDW